ncbi:MAG: lysophospholipid acyltransferase family protein [Nevskia sp.]|nr:lysophospholipid acyltransferase family protein [Nevskia sp.]
MRLGEKLNQVWRLFGTGLSFACFGVGGVVLSLTLFPLIRLTSPDADTTRRRIQRAMHHTFRLFVLQMRLLGLISYEVSCVERLNQRGRLVVANHPSLIDVVLLIALMPEADCIVKQALLRNPFLRWPVVWADYTPNHGSPEQLVEDAAAKLRAGRSLIVFPEGTRSVPGRPLTMQRGAARIALAAGAEILPVTIVCRPPMLTKGEPWYSIPAQPGHWQLQVGEPFHPADLAPPGVPEPVAARRLTQHFIDYFSGTLTAITRTQEPAGSVLAADCTMREPRSQESVTN